MSAIHPAVPATTSSPAATASAAGSAHRLPSPSPACGPPRRRLAVGRFAFHRRFTPAFLAAVLLATLLLAGPFAAPPAEATKALPAAGLLRATSVDALVADLQLAAPTLDRRVLGRAVASAVCAVEGGVRVKRPFLTVIDYSLPSTKPRLWVFDLATRSLLHHDLVAHGVGSGDNYARAFSNTPESRQSSLGLFLTAETYYGKNGYSLRLDGLESGINDLARPRTIVVHGAWYVSRDFARQHGRLGRSWGCPALPEAVAREVIDAIQGGSLLYVDHRENDGLRSSSYLTCGGSGGGTTVAAGAR